MFPHAHLHGADGGHESPRQGGQRRPHGKDDGKHAVDANTHPLRHLAVGRARAHPHAELGVADQQVQRQRGGQACGQNQQAVAGIWQKAEQLNRPRERRRGGRHDGRRPPDGFDHIVRNQDDAKGGKHLTQVVTRIELANEHGLQHRSQGHRDGNAHRNRQQERAAVRMHAGRDIAPGHKQRAVREVERVHDAEHQREARSQQKQHEAIAQAVEGLLQ